MLPIRTLLAGQLGHPGGGRRFDEGLAHFTQVADGPFGVGTGAGLAPGRTARPAVVLVLYRRLTGGDQVGSRRVPINCLGSSSR
jgi:hypothetical protein